MTIEDELRRHWRLIFREPETEIPAAIVIEHLDESVTSDWVEMEVVTHDLSAAGINASMRNVLLVDERKARDLLDTGIARFGSRRRLELGGPVSPGFRRINLLEYVFEIEGFASSSIAAEPAHWSPALTRVVANGTEGKAHVIADRVDPVHILYMAEMQPAAAGAMARKIREAWYLMQAASQAITILRTLSGLDGRMPGNSIESSLVIRTTAMLQSISERVAAFTMIDVPAVRGMP